MVLLYTMKINVVQENNNNFCGPQEKVTQVWIDMKVDKCPFN